MTFTLLNRILFALVILLVIVFVVLWGLSYNKPRIETPLQGGQQGAQVAQQPNATPEFSAYQKLLSERDLFFPGMRRGGGLQSTALDDLIRNLVLVGVIETDRPEAIIRDNRVRQTYFVTAGSKLGELDVVEVRKNSVLLEKGNETREIFIQ